MATLKQLSEQILRLHYGGDLSADNQLQRREIDLLVVQAINNRLKAERFNNLNAGSLFMDVPSAMIAQYVVPVPVDSVGTNLILFKQNSWSRSGSGSFGNSISTSLQRITLLNLSSSSLVNGSFVEYVQSFRAYPSKKYRVSFTAIESLLTSSPSGLGQAVAQVYIINDEGQEDILFENVIKNVGSNVAFSNTIELDEASVVYVRFRASASAGSYTGTILIGSIAVEQVEFQNKVTLPAQPISLPMNVGVWEVADERYPNDPYIPMPTGSFGLTRGLSISKLQGNVGYEVVGNQLHFKKDISSVKNLYVKLLVNDINASRVDDLLPIPTDMEAVIISDVRQMIAPVQKRDVSHDNVDKP